MHLIFLPQVWGVTNNLNMVDFTEPISELLLKYVWHIPISLSKQSTII